MSLHPGKQITDSLRLVRLLGRGAMGSVWVSDHLGLQSQVAVKFMSAPVADDPVSVRRFRLEAKAAAEIRSPHVVQVLDHGQTADGQLYIVMELLHGEPLERRVRRDGPLAGADLLAMVVQACKALVKAHERGIIHRDIKPDNVFLVAGDELYVKLLDFGVAKFAGEEAIEMTAAGNMVGTPAFMGPEQLFHGREVDHRGDLWSLAVVAYHALTGVRPFEGKTLGELCVAIKNGKYEPPSVRRPDLPPEVDGWFACAFHENIDARFQNAKAMAQSLESILGTTSVMQSTPSALSQQVQTLPGTSVSRPPGVTATASRRRKVITVGVTMTAVALLGTVALAISSRGTSASTGPIAVSAAPGGTPAAPPSQHPPPSPSEDEPGNEARSAVVESEKAEDDAGLAAGGGALTPRTEPLQPPPPPAAPAPVRSPDIEMDDRSKRAAETLGI